MDIEFIRKLIALARESGIAGLEFETGGEIVRINIAGGIATTTTTTSGVTDEMIEPTANDATPEPTEGANSLIRSGMVGTFYRASAPDAEPYVEEGDIVEEGQTLGLIEAMKMLNPIEADRAGRIRSIRVPNGELVERGRILFEIEGAN
jgi:acetyl-CoA carboxylase biotin carboxyl carrier protein